MKNVFNIANFIGFQAIWFTSIWFGNDLIWLALLLILAHVYWVEVKEVELTLLLGCATIGIGIDSFFTVTGVYIFTPVPQFLPIPLWLVAIWLGFAATLRHSLRYLMNNTLWAIIAGAVAGPLSYFAGQRLGAVEFGYDIATTLIILSVTWALLFPALLYFAAKLEFLWAQILNMEKSQV